MEEVALAAAAVGYLAPYAAQVADKVGKQIAGDLGDRLLALWDKVQGKLTSPAAKEALEDFRAKPDDERRKGALELQLEKAIEADVDFGKALAALVEDIKAKGGDSIVQTANTTGDHNVTTQITGSGNVVR